MAKIFQGVEDRARQLESLPSVSATQLVGAIQKVTATVASEGAMVVTRHDEPTMVLVSVERYLQMASASQPDLGALTRQFDELVASMQGREAAAAMAAAFAMTPEQLGAAAVRATR